MSTVDAIIMLDVQDEFFPPEVGGDDIIKVFADAFAAEGLVCNFLFFASRSLLLKQRRRTDVIRSLDPHEIGLHTPGPAHPVLSEYASEGDWFSALKEVERREQESANVFRDVFGRDPCALSLHGNYAAPHVFPVAAKMGLPYVYGFPASPPKNSITWYGGALNFAWRPVWSSAREEPNFELGDESWADDGLFHAALARLESFLDWCEAEDQPFMNLFLGHPFRVRCIDMVEYWWYPNGRNLPREVRMRNGEPRLRNDEQVAVARRNIRRLAEHVRGSKRLNIVSLPEAVSKYGFQPGVIEKKHLVEAAGKLCVHRAEFATNASPAQNPLPLDIPVGGPFSPAEVVLGLAESLLAYSQNGGLPASVRRQNVLGPTENPNIVPEVREVNWSQFISYVAGLLSEADRTGYLPANVGPHDSQVGLGSLYRAIAGSYLQVVAGERPSTVLMPRYPRYPSIAKEIGQQFAEVIEYDLVDPNLNAWNLEKHGRLQSWTLKPAWKLSEQK